MKLFEQYPEWLTAAINAERHWLLKFFLRQNEWRIDNWKDYASCKKFARKYMFKS